MVSPRARSFKRERRTFFYGCTLSLSFFWFSIVSSFCFGKFITDTPYNNIEQGYDMIII